MKFRNLIFGLVVVTVLAACRQPSSSEVPPSSDITQSSDSQPSSEWVAPEEVWSPTEHWNFTPLASYTGNFWQGINFDLRGEELKEQINTRMWADFVKVDYNTAYQAVRKMDADPNNANNILSIYDLKSMPWAGYNGGRWNREHAFPQSKLKDGDDSLGASATRKNISSDIANIFAADADLNTKRSNNSYGEWNYEDDPETLYPFTTVNTAKQRTDSILRRGLFSPTRLVRGEVARSQMYMLLMYPENCGLTENFAIETMIKWDRELAPTVERDGARQNAIYEYQSVRNPFIDNRDLSCYIWGDVNDFTRRACSAVL